ncbi:MAG: hypothetical protein KDJ41_07350 [Hyphomicrobiaceae bacterium]|nr:hypothetical protein [Hyphomicrobiaceae bacterium]
MWEALPFVLLAALVVLLPIGVMGLSASKLEPRRRNAFLGLYGAAVLLLVIVVFDIRGAFDARLAIDLILLLGGLGLGIFIASLFGLRWPDGGGEK